MHYKLLISSFTAHIELNIFSSSEFYAQLMTHTFWYEYIPGCQIKTTGASSILWNVTEQTTNDYNLKKRTIATSAAYIKEIIIIIESELERLRQYNGIYSFHGTSLFTEDQSVGVGFIGNISGIGKTTIAATAAKKGWTWIADEKFSIHNDAIVGGTKRILNDLKTNQAAGGIMPSATDKTPRLGLLCYAILTTEQSIVKFDMSYEKKLWMYNDEISRDIRQVNGMLTGFKHSLPSFDNPELSLARKESVEKLASTVNGVFMRGNAETILSEIKQLLT